MMFQQVAAISSAVLLASLSLQGCEKSDQSQFLDKVKAPSTTSSSMVESTSAVMTTLGLVTTTPTLFTTTSTGEPSATSNTASTSVTLTTTVLFTTTVEKGPTPVQKHGQLRVQGNVIVDESDAPVQLRGMSLFWSNWMPQYWTKETIQWLANDFKISVLRAPVGVPAEAGQGGYLEEPEIEMQHITTVVDAAIAAGIYVIVDWHDHHANLHTEQAKAFFGEMAKRYGNEPSVLFETFNEPIPGLTWETDIKPYHEAVLPEIRAHTENIVIAGTPEWSAWVNVSAADPVSASNVAYAVHFYAGAVTHGKPIRDMVQQALDLGVAVFATEWGTCHYSGEGALDLSATQTWLDFMSERHISDANWAVSDKQEACSALRPNTEASGWTLDELTESGKFMRASLINASSRA